MMMIMIFGLGRGNHSVEQQSVWLSSSSEVTYQWFFSHSAFTVVVYHIKVTRMSWSKIVRIRKHTVEPRRKND